MLKRVIFIFFISSIASADNWRSQIQIDSLFRNSSHVSSNYFSIEYKLGANFLFGITYRDSIIGLYNDNGAFILINPNVSSVIIINKSSGLRLTYYPWGSETSNFYVAGEMLRGNMFLNYNSNLYSTTTVIGNLLIGYNLIHLGKQVSLVTEFGNMNLINGKDISFTDIVGNIG